MVSSFWPLTITIEADRSSALARLVGSLPFSLGRSSQYSFLEFFAGIGLSRMGLEPLGWRCVYANDIETKKRRMYEGCFGRAEHYQVEDVWNTETVVAQIPLERADLASASFPCVDLSLAGNMKGLNGSQSGAFYGFIKVLRALRETGRLPRAVLVENVIGFMAAHDGKAFRIALKELAKLGYYFDAFVVDAKHFVPQSRPRLFLLGFLPEVVPDGCQLVASGNHEALRNHDLRDPRLRPQRLMQILKEEEFEAVWLPLCLPGLPPEQRTLAQLIDTGRSEEWWATALVSKHLKEMHAGHRERIEKLRDSKELTIGTIYRRVRNGKSRSEIRTDGLAGCLRTPRGGSSKQIVLVVGKGDVRMRWMSPREYARLQGCPNFPIEVERNEALYGFGDAVCVPVISWIAKEVLSQLFPARRRVNQSKEAAGD
jgi:DNA (cytosine-5)-methyltransferase 1